MNLLMLVIGAGIGVAIGGFVLWLLEGVIWHTYHGDIPELILKIVISLVVVGLGIAAILGTIALLGII